MKKVLMTLAVLAASTSVMAQDTDNCYTMEVPPLMTVFGQSPNQKAYVQISSNDQDTLVKILTKTKIGNSMFASRCTLSRGDIFCDEPFAGKGSVQILKVEKTLTLSKVALAMETSSVNATKILGTHQNLKLNDISCQELINTFSK
ncbi:MAG: hypothetical protein J0M15_09235 [Deltaproteobacteria bacterium]|jgi:hypothetical protein|nr:hypothetical protein [Deltaproteobacteria bacterium]